MELISIQRAAARTVDELFNITGKIDELIEGYGEVPDPETRLKMSFLGARCREIDYELQDIQCQLDSVAVSELSPEKASSLSATKQITAWNRAILKEKQELLESFEKHADITRSRLRASKILEQEADIRKLRALLNQNK